MLYLFPIFHIFHKWPFKLFVHYLYLFGLTFSSLAESCNLYLLFSNKMSFNEIEKNEERFIQRRSVINCNNVVIKIKGKLH